MRLPLAVSAIAVVAIAVAACTGSPPSTFVTPPVSSAATTGAATLSGGTSALQSAGTVGAVSGILTYVGGAGTVTAASSASAPAGTTAVTPMSGLRVEATSPPTSPNIYYVTITSAAGATLTALPAVNLTLSTPSVGTYQEAQFLNGKWSNIAASTSNTTSGQGATSVSFPQGKTVVTIPAGGSVFLAFYQGSFPGPTPPGAVTNTAVADPGFEGTAAPLGSTVSKTGWTVCTITAAGTGASFPGNRPVSSFTPVPGSTPVAFIETANTSVPQGTGTPHPTQTTVPVENGNQAAVFGAVFSNFNAADFAYNGLCQTVTIPANPLGSVAVFANGTENSSTFLGFQVNILDTTGKYLANIVDENQIQTSPPGDTAYRAVPLLNSALSPFAGQTVELYVGIWTKAGSSTGSQVFSGYYFVDDIAIAAGS